MQIRPVVLRDVEALGRIDGTIESSQYLHLEIGGAGLATRWSLQERALRQRRVQPNVLSNATKDVLNRLAGGSDEGVALMAEYDGAPIALVVAVEQPAYGTLHVLDVRIDASHRRQGIGTALLYKAIGSAQARGLRAVSLETRTDNVPACRLLTHCGFVLSGVDARRHSNHDVVKESATLFWYAPLD